MLQIVSVYVPTELHDASFRTTRRASSVAQEIGRISAESVLRPRQVSPRILPAASSYREVYGIPLPACNTDGRRQRNGLGTALAKNRPLFHACIPAPAVAPELSAPCTYDIESMTQTTTGPGRSQPISNPRRRRLRQILAVRQSDTMRGCPALRRLALVVSGTRCSVGSGQRYTSFDFGRSVAPASCRRQGLYTN